MAERLLLEGADLSELMDHVRSEYGPHARIVRAERVRQGGFAGFFAKEKYELTIDVPAMPPVKALRSHRAPASDMDSLLDAADAGDSADGARVQISADPQAAAQAATPRAATGGSQFSSVLDQVRALADSIPETAPVEPPEQSDELPAVSPGGHDMPTALQSAELRTALTAIGVPSELLNIHPLTMAGVIDQIPVAGALPRHAGEILTLVGSSADIAVLEPLLTDRMRLSPAEIVHVGSALRFDLSAPGQDRPTRVTSPQALAAWRSRAPMARHPWLVLIPLDGDAEARSEVAEMVLASRPTQFWAVVDARTKPGDASRWLDQIGMRRAVDAIVVRALMDTSAPGTVLGLGRPVAWLDGLPVSRMVWAAALGQPFDAAFAGS